MVTQAVGVRHPALYLFSLDIPLISNQITQTGKKRIARLFRVYRESL
jgi:hypothetical protein